MPELSQILEQIWNFDLTSLDGVSLTAIFVIIAASTLVTEDGACLAAGALAGHGRITFAFAVSACFAGIVIGDVGLYFFGRLFGNSITKTRLFKRFVSEEALVTASEWLEKRGVAAIFISRFVAGLRLPTYLAAGFLKTNFLKFLFFFIVAAAAWTPLIVGSAAFAQKFISPQYFLVSIIGLYLLIHLGFNLTTWTRRRLFIGKLKRIRNWEFWPLWIFYFPVVLYVFALGIRHRSLTVFTCANPAIPGGGFIGESKDEIYAGLGHNDENRPFMLQHFLVPENDDFEIRFEEFKNQLKESGLSYPVVIKPDAGERGKEVAIVGDAAAVKEVLESPTGDLLVQEFIDGPEISVFYYRYPSKPDGRIFSITSKVFPIVTGDGTSSLEELILMDPRAVCLAGKYFEQNHERLMDIPPKGDEVKIINIGTHSRGAIFGDGGSMLTPELESAIDRIVKNYDGFYFGRFDLRAGSVDDFQRGENFKIIELNGVTSESTNIYDKRYSLFAAYKILFQQWRTAFEIGAENAKRGCAKTPLRELFRSLFGFKMHDSN